jgi:hypothetical protein
LLRQGSLCYGGRVDYVLYEILHICVGNCAFTLLQHTTQGARCHKPQPHRKHVLARNLCRSVCHVLIPAIDWNTSCRRHRKIPHPHRIPKPKYIYVPYHTYSQKIKNGKTLIPAIINHVMPTSSKDSSLLRIVT